MTTTTSTSRRSSSDGSGPELTVRRQRGAVHVRCSTVVDGDFHPTRVSPGELEVRRRHLVDLPWTMLAQHHGVTVVEVDVPGAGDGAAGDVAVTSVHGAVLGCWVADCAPVVIVGDSGRIAAAHAGWRGLAGGVLDVAANAVGEPLATVVLGPTIGPCCYEFGAADLRRVAAGLGVSPATVTSATTSGAVALDIPAAISGFAERHGARLEVLGGCTGCTYPGYSHRVRGETSRHVVAVWLAAEAA